MSRGNIAIFVPHVGCPHKCAFCDQRTITGQVTVPHAEDVRAACRQALSEMADPTESEIAFFGGSFTAIPRGYMLELLGAAGEFIGEGRFKGVRISTRPDCIDPEVLAILKERGVTAIELGAQSMNDRVLALNERGHDVKSVYEASRLIRGSGFELGLQIMTGLYGSGRDEELETRERVLEICPDTVRIYPVCVLEGTRLAELYRAGEYRLMSFEDMLGITAADALAFSRAGIRILRIGLHASEGVERGMTAGYYHPALGELVRGRIVRQIAEESLAEDAESVTVFCGSGMISAASGHKRSNKTYFAERGVRLETVPDPTLGSKEIRIDREVYKCI